MRDVFERPEFQRSKSWLEKVMDWLRRHLDFEIGGGSGWGGSIGSIVSWVAIVLLVVGLAIVVYFVVRNWSPRVKAKRAADLVEVDVEELRTASEWASEADRLEAAGQWKDAMRARYRELVAQLVESEVAAPLAGRTTGELRRDIAERAPQVSDEFSHATVLFEMPWYADVPTGAAENAEFKHLAARVLEGAA